MISPLLLLFLAGAGLVALLLFLLFGRKRRKKEQFFSFFPYYFFHIILSCFSCSVFPGIFFPFPNFSGKKPLCNRRALRKKNRNHATLQSMRLRKEVVGCGNKQ